MKIVLMELLGLCEDVNVLLERADTHASEGDAQAELVVRMAALELLYPVIGKLVGLRSEIEDRNQHIIFGKETNAFGRKALNAKLRLTDISNERTRLEVVTAFLEGFDDARDAMTPKSPGDEIYVQGHQLGLATMSP